ncbi:hypothetical protein VPH35_047022 [Triticum aestivum]
MAKFALGHHSEATDAGCVRAVLAEAVLTFLFVFSGVGSTMAAGRLAGGADTIMGLTAVALAHAMVVAVMVSAGLHVSGGHINPAVTRALPRRRRPHHPLPLRALRARAAARLLPRLPPPRLPHRRRGDHASARAGRRGWRAAGGALGGRAHLLAALHGVRDRRGSATEHRQPGPATGGLRRRRQRARRRAVLRRVYEPGTFIRARARLSELGQSVGLLGWADDWWAARGASIRGIVHGPARPPAASQRWQRLLVEQ